MPVRCSVVRRSRPIERCHGRSPGGQTDERKRSGHAKPLFRTKFRPGTWKRYEGILSQGLLEELGDKNVDEVTAPTVRAFMAVLGKRGIQSRGPVNLVRTLLTAAVETGVLDAMPELPKPRHAAKRAIDR